MTTLVLEMRQGDLLIVNGAPIRFRNRARIELAGRARFLFGKQILAAEAATTPARRIYFALQTAYVGPEPERAGGMELARGLVEDFLGSEAGEAAKVLIQKR
ncbi:flagellar biosynthesis repressor FlbT [Pseudoroseomonas wenyumeiae]